MAFEIEGQGVEKHAGDDEIFSIKRRDGTCAFRARVTKNGDGLPKLVIEDLWKQLDDG